MAVTQEPAPQIGSGLTSPLTKCLSFRVRQHRIAPGLLYARRNRIYGPWDSFVAQKERRSTLSTGCLPPFQPWQSADWMISPNSAARPNNSYGRKAAAETGTSAVECVTWTSRHCSRALPTAAVGQFARPWPPFGGALVLLQKRTSQSAASPAASSGKRAIHERRVGWERKLGSLSECELLIHFEHQGTSEDLRCATLLRCDGRSPCGARTFQPSWSKIMSTTRC